MIRIALYRPYDLIDKTICFFSRGNYCHTAIVFKDGSAIEARPFKKVRKIPNLWYERKQNQVVEVYDIETTISQEKIIKKFLKRQLGKSYDYFSVVGFTVNKTEIGRKEYGRWFCSELVFCAFKQAGINLLERIYQWEATPVIVSYSEKLKLNKVINKKGVI